MTWDDHGLILSVRRHGEHDAIITLLTEHNGRYAGLVKAGASRRLKGLLQPGNVVKATWRARLDEHLGTITADLVHSYSASLMDDADRLAALSSLCALIDAALPERQPQPEIEKVTIGFLEGLSLEGWAARYARWELEVLRDLGFGLDLSACAGTGTVDNLVYVSPRSGRAVSAEAGAPYASRLLALPAFLREEIEDVSARDVASALALTGHFFEAHVFNPHRQPMPAARVRLVARLRG
ncbi:MAG: DNA repair protein RecO [Rhodospirillaceae bacterium]|nr:DNA repair protein RecO [Rhodospirillaceae bacterium]